MKAHRLVELGRLKDQVIVLNPRKTLYDLLFMKRNLLARYAKNENFRQFYDECEGNFRKRYEFYGQRLNKCYNCGDKRRRLVELAIKSFKVIIGLPIPDSCSDRIFEYLSDASLCAIEYIHRMIF